MIRRGAHGSDGSSQGGQGHDVRGPAQHHRQRPLPRPPLPPGHARPGEEPVQRPPHGGHVRVRRHDPGRRRPAEVPQLPRPQRLPRRHPRVLRHQRRAEGGGRGHGGEDGRPGHARQLRRGHRRERRPRLRAGGEGGAGHRQDRGGGRLQQQHQHRAPQRRRHLRRPGPLPRSDHALPGRGRFR